MRQMNKSRDLPFDAMKGAKGKVRSNTKLVIHELFNRCMYVIICTPGNTCSRTFFVKTLCLPDIPASPLAPVPAHITSRFLGLHPNRDSP